jgi:Fe-S cluster assembly protein SufD
MSMTANTFTIKSDNNIESVLHSSFKLEKIPKSNHSGIDAWRKKAWESFKELSLPSKKEDAWKRVDIDSIPLDMFNSSNENEAPAPSECMVDGIDKIKELGVFAGTIGEGIKYYPAIIEKAITDLIDPKQDLFAAMAAAYADDGQFIYIPAGIQVAEPIRVNIKQKPVSGTLFNHMIWLEEKSQATIILEDITDIESNVDPCVSVGNVGLHLGESARLQFVEIHTGSQQSWQIVHEKAILDKGSQLEWLVYALDGRFAKYFIRVDLSGQGANTKMAGLYIPSGKQQIEFNTRQNHNAPDTKSDLLYKGVLLDESKSLFSGMIHVSPGAVKTDGYQANRNLIIGTNAHADSLPGLEILADDVRCTHGATVGKIDPSELFYLQSRGLGDRDAQRLIIQGFLDPIIQMMTGETDRTLLQNRIESMLS